MSSANDILDELLAACDIGYHVHDGTVAEMLRDGTVHAEAVCVSRGAAEIADESDNLVYYYRHEFSVEVYVARRDVVADRRAADIVEALVSALRRASLGGYPLEVRGWTKQESDTELSAVYSITVVVYLADIL